MPAAPQPLLREHDYKYSIIRDREFHQSKLVLKQRDTSFTQLVNFVTLSGFCFFFGNRVWLNLYERALSENELSSIFLKETTIIIGSFY